MLNKIAKLMPWIVAFFAGVSVLAACLGDNNQARMKKESQQILKVSNAIGSEINNYLNQQFTVLDTLNPGCKLNQPAEKDGLQSLLLNARQKSSFTTLFIADQDGIVLLGDPLRKPNGQRFEWNGLRIFDREYFIYPMQTGKNHLSQAFVGRVFGSDNLVGLSSPIFCHNKPIGIVVGSLALKELDALLIRSANFVDMLLLDQGDQVLWSNTNLELQLMQSISRSPLAIDKIPVANQQPFETRLQPTSETRSASKLSLLGNWSLISFGSKLESDSRTASADMLAFLLAAFIGSVFGLITREFLLPKFSH